MECAGQFGYFLLVKNTHDVTGGGGGGARGAGGCPVSFFVFSFIQDNIRSSSLPSLKLKSLTVVPNISSDPWLVFSLLFLDANTWVTALPEAELPLLDLFTIPRQTHLIYYNTTELKSKTCINLLERKCRWIYFALLLYSHMVSVQNAVFQCTLFIRSLYPDCEWKILVKLTRFQCDLRYSTL